MWCSPQCRRGKTDYRWSSFWVGREEALKRNPYLVGQKAPGKPYLQWPIALGMPPFMEYAAYSFWKVAAACGDGGKLCPAGFLLFDEFHKGSAMRQAEFWTAYERLQGAFAKSMKAGKELGGLPVAEYWLHGGNTVPDQSAEHAPGPRAELMNWYKGPIHPHVKLPGMTENYAPAVVRSSGCCCGPMASRS